MTKKKFIVIALCIVLVASGITAFVRYEKNSSSLDFQAYEPQALPSGLRVAERTIDIWSDKNNPFVSSKRLDIRFDQSRGHIGQASVSDDAPGEMICDERAINVTCKILVTPEGQQYKVKLTYNLNRNKELSGQMVRWFKGDTSIWLSLDNSIERALSQDEMNRMIDSFRPVTYADLPTKHYTPGP